MTARGSWTTLLLVSAAFVLPGTIRTAERAAERIREGSASRTDPDRTMVGRAVPPGARLHVVPLPRPSAWPEERARWQGLAWDRAPGSVSLAKACAAPVADACVPAEASGPAEADDAPDAAAPSDPEAPAAAVPIALPAGGAAAVEAGGALVEFRADAPAAAEIAACEPAPFPEGAAPELALGPLPDGTETVSLWFSRGGGETDLPVVPGGVLSFAVPVSDEWLWLRVLDDAGTAHLSVWLRAVP